MLLRALTATVLVNGHLNHLEHSSAGVRAHSVGAGVKNYSVKESYSKLTLRNFKYANLVQVNTLAVLFQTCNSVDDAGAAAMS